MEVDPKGEDPGKPESANDGNAPGERVEGAVGGGENESLNVSESNGGEAGSGKESEKGEDEAGEGNEKDGDETGEGAEEDGDETGEGAEEDGSKAGKENEKDGSKAGKEDGGAQRTEKARRYAAENIVSIFGGLEAKMGDRDLKATTANVANNIKKYRALMVTTLLQGIGSESRYLQDVFDQKVYERFRKKIDVLSRNLAEYASNKGGGKQPVEGIVVYFLLFSIFLAQYLALIQGFPERFEFLFNILEHPKESVMHIFSPSYLSLMGVNLFYRGFLLSFGVLYAISVFVYVPRYLYQKRRAISYRTYIILYLVFLGAFAVIFVTTNVCFDFNPMVNATFTLQLIMAGLKTHSFFFTAPKFPGKEEEEEEEDEEDAKRYSINYLGFLRFMVSPQLYYDPYQVIHNLLPRRDYAKILKNFVGMVVVSAVGNIVFHFFVKPVLESSPEIFPWKDMISHHLLILPTSILWWVVFLSVFKFLVAFINEILRISNDQTFGDWWNMENVKDFWRKWNLIFHMFAKRHIFYILRSSTHLGSMLSMFIVFVWSGILHEMVLGSTFKVLGFVYFLAFVLQGVIIFLQSSVFPKSLRSGIGGNILGWLNLYLGVSGIAMIYYRLYYFRTIEDSGSLEQTA